ncbi:hypothetical protein H310_12224 [Aphanomyces invadans]|uniref:Uncharacterized protein n=1 Tax=Aphanomyces invadans TaxID=157072 RepID=A0A024TJU7_9STRA|nr:hypothetical protein H310_12224 [Aphanomyces invadans]ETV93876.1 hypothetical protein H310_12224 [Aphanomyces invadans]|eukprot:XP_008877436.1 hypothetical protein H310_12224 [Aphanomyces invadans]
MNGLGGRLASTLLWPLALYPGHSSIGKHWSLAKPLSDVTQCKRARATMDLVESMHMTTKRMEGTRTRPDNNTQPQAADGKSQLGVKTFQQIVPGLPWPCSTAQCLGTVRSGQISFQLRQLPRYSVTEEQ